LVGFELGGLVGFNVGGVVGFVVVGTSEGAVVGDGVGDRVGAGVGCFVVVEEVELVVELESELLPSSPLLLPLEPDKAVPTPTSVPTVTC
jgi:arylamine N-acetyltransferase